MNCVQSAAVVWSRMPSARIWHHWVRVLGPSVVLWRQFDKTVLRHAHGPGSATALAGATHGFTVRMRMLVHWACLAASVARFLGTLESVTSSGFGRCACSAEYSEECAGDSEASTFGFYNCCCCGGGSFLVLGASRCGLVVFVRGLKLQSGEFQQLPIFCQAESALEEGGHWLRSQGRRLRRQAAPRDEEIDGGAGLCCFL